MKQVIKNTLKLYSFSLVFPLGGSIINLFCGIVGIPSYYGFAATFKHIWVDYLIKGQIQGVQAWRIHIWLIVLIFIVTMVNEIETKRRL